MTGAAENDAVLLDSKKKMISGTYLRNAWYVAAWSDDLADGQLLGRTIMKEPVVLYRKADGNVAALQDRCPHRFAPLHMGKIVHGDRVQCPYHGLEFDASGACVLNPHGTQEHSAARAGAQLSGDREAQGDLDLDGRAAGRPVEGAGLQRARQRSGDARDQARQHHHPRQLRADHRQPARPEPHRYLHDGILGNADTVESEITVEQDGDDVVVGRHASSATAPGLFAILMPSNPGRVDKFTRMRWMPPSNLRLVTGICMPGAVPESGTGYHAIHMLTPETDRTTHYFFTAVRFNVHDRRTTSSTRRSRRRFRPCAGSRSRSRTRR